MGHSWNGPFSEWAILGMGYSRNGPFSERAILGTGHSRNGPFSAWAILGTGRSRKAPKHGWHPGTGSATWRTFKRCHADGAHVPLRQLGHFSRQLGHFPNGGRRARCFLQSVCQPPPSREEEGGDFGRQGARGAPSPSLAAREIRFLASSGLPCAASGGSGRELNATLLVDSGTLAIPGSRSTAHPLTDAIFCSSLHTEERVPLS